MRIGVPAESRPGETRVAATPETVKKLAAQHEVVVQSGAGVHAAAIDDAYVAAGARIGLSSPSSGLGDNASTPRNAKLARCAVRQ